MIPTCVEPELYPRAQPLPCKLARSAGCDLVWIGSSSTLQGLEQQRSLWDRIGREIPGLRIRVICDRFPGFETLRVVPIPWSQVWEGRDLAAGQIGISWLPEDPWSRGKCGLKVLQYQAASLPVVANPVGMHTELIAQGVTGFLPRTADEWVEAICTLTADESLRLRMGRKARQLVETGYSVSAWADTFVSSVAPVESQVSYDSVVYRRPSNGAIPDPFFLRLRRMRGQQRSLLTGRPDDDRPTGDPTLSQPLQNMHMISTARQKPTAQYVQQMFQPPEWRWVQTGKVGWWLRGPWEESLLGPDGLRLEEWRNEGRLTTVKSGPHRIVYRVDLPEGAIYIKHFLVPDYRAMFRQWFRRGKGRNEGKRSQFLAEIGVPTIHPIALGEQRSRKFLFENYLITWEIPGTIPLDEFLEKHLELHSEPLRSQLRQRLATSLAILTARLHNAGMTHIDFHPGNILVSLNSEQMPVLTMIDLDALRQNKQLKWPRAQQNLALLDHYFWLRCSRSDRYRFLKAYLENRSERVADARGFAAGIESSTRAWAERLWKRWGRRCCSTNKYFQIYKHAACWSIAVRDLDRSVVEVASGGSRRPVYTPADGHAQELADLGGRRDHHAGERPANPGHLQTIQPQKVDRPLAQPGTPFPRMAVLAGGPASGQPGNTDSTQPALHSPQTSRRLQFLLVVPATRNVPGDHQAGPCHDAGGVCAQGLAHA